MQLGLGKEGEERLFDLSVAALLFAKTGNYALASNASRHKSLTLTTLDRFEEARTAASDALKFADRGIIELGEPRAHVGTDPFYECHFFKICARTAMGESYQAEALKLGLESSPGGVLLQTSREWFARAE